MRVDVFDSWPAALLVVLALVVLATVAVAVYLFIRLLRTYQLVRNEAMPTGGKVAFWVAAIYVLSPVDLLPDPIVLDDIAALVATLTYVTNMAKQVGLLDGSESAGRDRSGLASNKDVIDVSLHDDT